MATFQQNIAVVIGINHYEKGIVPLATAVNDATALAQVLETEHQYQVRLGLDEQATRNHLIQLVEETLPQIVTAEDRVLFYFAGHGIALNGEQGPEGYLIPQDARLGEVSSYLSMVRLNRALNQLPCRHFLAIFDCCFAGAFRWSSTRHIASIPKVIHQERFDRFITDPAWQVITSAASDQKALDALTLLDADSRGQVGRHSPFAVALLEAFQGQADIYPPAANHQPAGDGVITATELYLYLRDRVEPLTQDKRQRQTPGIWLLPKHDKGEYIFLSPGHPLNLPPAPPLDVSKNPYRGLESFDTEHSALFFGRSVLIQKLADFLQNQPLTIVLGASGSGKSSLVKAGLIPHLQQSIATVTGQPTWTIIPPFRPGELPLKALDNALNQRQLSQYLAAWCKKSPQTKLVLVIDQLEELITLGSDDAQQKDFLQALAQALEQYPETLRIVLTLRSDFEPQFQDSALGKLWHSARFVVPPMNRSELRTAIEEPASQRVMYFQSDDPNHPLVEQIIDEVAEMPGALPLLSFTLSELYLKYLQQQQDASHRGDTIDRAITEADYRALGGVAHSLTQRADQEYKALVQTHPGYATLIPQVMLRLVAVRGGEVARRRVPLSEFEYPPDKNEQVKEVLRCFTAARLLVEGQDLDGNPYVEPAHDALVRGWQRLLSWQQEAEENLPLQRRLTPAATEWKSVQQTVNPSPVSATAQSVLYGIDRVFYGVEHLLGKIPAQLGQLWRKMEGEKARSPTNPTQFLWNANPYLDVLQSQLNSKENGFNQVEADFIQASVLRRRQNRSWRWRLAIVVISGLSGLTIIALFNLRTAQIRQAQASREAAETRLLLNNSLEGMIESLQAATALQQGLLNVFPPHSTIREQITGTLQEALYTVRERDRLPPHQGTVRSQFSPDGQLIASAGNDDFVRLSNPQGQTITQWDTDQGTVMNLNFSPDSQRIATAGSDSTIRLWDLQGQLLAELTGHIDRVKGIDFSADGYYLATSSRDQTVRLWSSQGQPLATMVGHTDDIWSVVFTSDSQTLASVAEDGTVRFWDLQGNLIQQFRANQGELHGIAFSPDGKQLVTSGEKGSVRLWSRKGELLTELEGHQGRVWDAAFTPNGQYIASAAGDGTVRIWNLQGEQLLQLNGHQGPVRSVSFRPDGQVLTSGGDDGTVRLWNLKDKALRTLQGHQGSVSSVAFTPSGKNLATTDEYGMIRLWNREGQLQSQFRGHDQAIRSIHFSPNGQQLATDAGTNIHLWDLQGKLLGELRGHDNFIRRVAFSPDGQNLVSAGDDGTIRLWNRYGQNLATWPADQKRVWDVSFSPDSLQLASVGDDGVVRLWNLRGQQLGQLTGHLGSAYSVAFSPNGQQLVTSGQDGTIRVWDIEKMDKVSIFQIVEAQAEVNFVAFHPNGKMIVSGDNQGNVQLWSLRLGEQFASWIAHPNSIIREVSFHPDGQTIVTSADDETAKLWQIQSFETLLKTACRQVKNHLVTRHSVPGNDQVLNCP